jgi:hypothetical protein
MGLDRFGGDTRAGIERVVVWLVALAVVAAIAGSVLYLADDLRRDAPDTDFSVSFDEETRTVTVTHAGGDAITDRVTERLAVVLEDESTGATANVTWVRDTRGPTTTGFGYPVSQGETLTVDDPTVDADGDGNFHDADRSVGLHLAENDTVRVVWTGNRQGGPARTVTLANATLG